jgi:hypothetical protein
MCVLLAPPIGELRGVPFSCSAFSPSRPPELADTCAASCSPPPKVILPRCVPALVIGLDDSAVVSMITRPAERPAGEPLHNSAGGTIPAGVLELTLSQAHLWECPPASTSTLEMVDTSRVLHIPPTARDHQTGCGVTAQMARSARESRGEAMTAWVRMPFAPWAI